MRVGLVGYAGSGKTTLLDAVAEGRRGGDLAAVPVPDARFELLCRAESPKKRTPASVEILDNAARMPEGGAKTGFAEDARRLDALVHVVREFDDPAVPFHAPPDPARDQGAVEAELVLADLQLAENRIERLGRSPASRTPGHPEYAERTLFEKAAPLLEEGVPVRSMGLSEEELRLLSGYQLLTAKPLIVAVNCGEKAIGNTTDFERGLSVPVFRLCAKLEFEISALEPDERGAFLDDLGISEPASVKMVKVVYDALGLVTFFTTAEDKARAWPLRAGSTALKAADAIHSDIARGFIRAEVVHFADFEKAGSLKACHAENLVSLEGRDYVVRDGDIMKIRHKT